MAESAISKPDFLDEMIAESTARNPEFPKLMEAARRRRELEREQSEHARESRPQPTDE